MDWRMIVDEFLFDVVTQNRMGSNLATQSMGQGGKTLEENNYVTEVHLKSFLCFWSLS